MILNEEKLKKILINLWAKFAKEILPKEEVKEITEKKLFKFKKNKFGFSINDSILGVRVFTMSINGKLNFRVTFDEDSPIIKGLKI